ncbi:MAG TPA: nucleoid-associated protein [Tenuifilaceae bacterium]|nr:nucleoid-associated protein [Tenuifilaceae bacterium]
MLDFTQVALDNIAIHRVGSSAREGELFLAQKLVDIQDENVLFLLQHYFLTPFKPTSFFSFSHDAKLELNEVYSYVTEIFQNPDSLLEQSANIARCLHAASQHPNIKEGELYVVRFSDCVVEGELVDALGIFKSESKEHFIKVYQKQNSFGVDADEGISIHKLDKGCLIFNTEQELGFKVCVVDSTNKSDEARFWKDQFLKIKPREDNFYQTSGYIDLCKSFVKEVFNDENNVEKPDQLTMMNKSRDFFQQKEVFNQSDFELEVMQEPEIIEAFRDYKEKYQTEQGCNLRDEFTISTDAAKQAKKVFKSVIKLDKNFHLYIHGGRERVERGTDEEKGLHFYKLYFENEE